MEQANPQKRKYLFTVDILIEEESNGRALEKLLHLLNSKTIEDYNIKQGVELGKKIESALKDSIINKIKDNELKKKSAASAPPSDPYRHIWDKLTSYKECNSLVRLTVVKGKGIKLSMPCRIISTDPPSGNFTAYHVDEKKVYLLNINEIDDIQA
ncbi:hypothetical protein [Paenibacillus cremeus]|uniref:Uncharacterized protein n=1 Tax=Paenibacillus cremeus TaxID=2163881 RepID=A0A559KE49_9BACL|nr:hypothetical protein [Paenibacillus cremeus]TVY10406.1 hypothetical protein FPZ49_08395 [Paenibacillus cremeus]